MIKHIETDLVRVTRRDHGEHPGMEIAPTLSGDGRAPLWLGADEFEDLVQMLVRLHRDLD